MRRAALAALLVAGALLLQLTAVNRLPLPGGGAPDLVLLVVIALALSGGPEMGMLTGFCAGLSLDLAPPASQLIGEYALVFCVIGYACGKLRGALGRSALLPLVAAAAAAAAAGEALYAGLGLALDPARITSATVRQVLPSSVLYDVVISAPVMFLVLLASRWVNEYAGSAARSQQAGSRPVRSPAGWPRPPGFRPARFRPGRARPARTRPIASRSARVRPRSRSARTGAGIQLGPRRRPVNLRLAAGRRGGKFRGAAGHARSGRGEPPRSAFSGRGGRGSTASWSTGTGRGTVRPGAGRPARSSGFRPAAGFPGGSAGASRPQQRPSASRPVSLRMHTGRRRDAGAGGGMLTGRGLSGRRQAVSIRFRPGRAVGFRPGRAVGLRAARFGSGRRSVGSIWGRKGTGRRSNAWRTGGRRTGGSR